MGESIDDASVTALVKMTLLFHRSTSALHPQVETKKRGGKLGWSGQNAAEKDLVTRYVQDINGVTDVANHMTIAGGKHNSY